MKTLKINWIKEMKNSVSFAIFVNGRNCGIIKRGETRDVPIQDENNEVYFVPQAPKFFGWRALKLKMRVYDAAPVMNLCTSPDPGTFSQMSFQLACSSMVGMNIISKEYIKQYR